MTLPQDAPSIGSHVGIEGSSQQAPVWAPGRPVPESAPNDSIRLHSCNQPDDFVPEDCGVGYQRVAPTRPQLERKVSQPTAEIATAELGLQHQLQACT